MKQMIKNTITIVALLLVSMGAVADGLISKKIITIDGTPSSEDIAGTINYSNGEITITPKSGYYFSLDDPNDLIVIKTIGGENAQTRTPNINTPLEVTAKDATADPSKETKYIFTVTDEKYDYEITANFHSRTSIESNYDITLEEGPFTYSGTPIKPGVTFIVNDVTLTKGTDYEVQYSDSINAGTGKVTVIGVRKYTGSLTGIGESGIAALQYKIEKASIKPEVKITGWTYGSYDAAKNSPSLTDGTNPGNGEVHYYYKEKDADDETYSEDIPTKANNYTVKAIVAETDNHQEGTGTADFTIGKAQAELKYSTDKATAAMGAEFKAPTLTITPEGLEGIIYTSSNTDVATINTEGKVTLVGEGETVIKASFPGNDNYNAAEASYTLTVEKGVGTGYPLWIGETQVTKENCENILGGNAQTFVFNPLTNTLIITNNQDKDLVIESRLDELTIYLNGDKGNKLKKVFYNNLGNAENKGKLVFTTNYNKPGAVDFKNEMGESVITGFETIEFDSKSQLTFALPEKTTYKYENGVMNKIVEDENGTETTTPAEELSIGQALTPIDEVVTFTLNNLYMRDENGKLITDENGSPQLPNLVNSVVKDVLITLPQSNDDNSGDGISIDDSDGRPGITIETESMTDDKVKTIAQKVISSDDYFPGSDDFAKDFVGMTILLPACIGTIDTDLDIDPGYEFHALIAEKNNDGTLKSTIKVIGAGEVETPFEVALPTYCYIYLVKTGGASTRLGKRTKAHGKVYTVGIEVNKAMSTNPPSEASGGVLPVSADPVLNTTDPDPDPDPYYPPYPYTPPTAIENVDQDTTDSDKWFTIEGQRIETPKKKGIYIKNGKKVVIK